MMKETPEKENVNGFTEEKSPSVDETNQPDMADNVSDESFEENDISAQLSDAATEWKDKYLRLVAEFDNYRKRTLREKMDLISSGGEDIVKSMLPVMDDIDRAVDALESAKDVESMKEGVYLIRNKLSDALKAKGLDEIEAIGKELDTDLHEAVAKIPAEGGKKGKIVDVVQKGYKMKDKVMRYAKVVVGE